MNLAHSCLAAPSTLFPSYWWSKSMGGNTPSCFRWTPACRMTPSSSSMSLTSEAGSWRPSSPCRRPPLPGGRPQQLIKELKSSSAEPNLSFLEAGGLAENFEVTLYWSYGLSQPLLSFSLKSLFPWSQSTWGKGSS